VQVVHCEHPAKNDSQLVSQVNVKAAVRACRPVLVVGELKNTGAGEWRMRTFDCLTD
jgi:hypothetical protein